MEWRVLEPDRSFVITATRSVFVPADICCKTGKIYCGRCWFFELCPLLVGYGGSCKISDVMCFVSLGSSESCSGSTLFCIRPSSNPGKFEDLPFVYRFEVDSFPEVKVVDEEGQSSTILLTSEEDPAFLEEDCYWMSDDEYGSNLYQWRAALRLADGQTCPLGKYVTSKEGVDAANNVVSMINKIRQTAQHRK